MDDLILNKNKTVFSGIQPTGTPMIGNYIGAMKNMVALQKEYNSIYCIVDMHAITVRQDPAAYRKKIKSLFALYMAVGIDPSPDKSILFVQSHVLEHAQLAWILNCFTYFGELSRMTQFKDKSRKHADNVNAGLFDYPVLMAADVLLYQTHLVPVGDDQKQHMELTRDIAIRMNNIYGDVFVVPEIFMPETGARIMKLQDPLHKMDKSETENINNSIFMLDEPNVILSKVRKAVTDSEALVKFDPENKPGVSNLLSIYSSLLNKSIEDSENDFSGKNYGYFKDAVGEVIVSTLAPIQKKYNELMSEKGYIESLMAPNADRARNIARKTLAKLSKKIGFI